MTDPSSPQILEAAKKRIIAKRTFWLHLGLFVLVNATLLVVWAITSTGYFWPGWVIAGWGIGLAIHAAISFVAMQPISEARISQEISETRRAGRDA